MSARIPMWNAFFSVLFLAVVLYGAAYLSAYHLLPQSITLSDFVLLALAIFRLTRLVTYDHITAFVRDACKPYPPESFLGTLGTLLACPWCVGLWFGFFVPFFFFAFPNAWFIVLVLALAALGTFFQLLANWVGWSAEAKKREVQGIPLPR